MSINKNATFKCVDCGEKFEYGDWEGCKKNAGGAHPVKAKTYYSKYPGYNHEWKMGSAYTDPQGNKQVTAGKRAQFQGGTFITTDPEAQAFLDEETVRKVLITKEIYEKINTPVELRNERLQRKVEEQGGLMESQAARIAELEAERGAGKSRRKPA